MHLGGALHVSQASAMINHDLLTITKTKHQSTK